MKNKEKLLRTAPYTQKLTTGAYPKYPLLENELFEWFKESQNQLKVISRYIIQTKARFLAKKTEYQIEYPNIKDAKFSQKWVDGFISCHNLINRRKTTVTQRLPENYIEQ